MSRGLEEAIRKLNRMYPSADGQRVFLLLTAMVQKFELLVSETLMDKNNKH
jgi:hypothetical protein